ncbi:DNA N(6)-methyladenine demethylase ALKBH1C-like [Tasmannia lanceolata]|uniref:DNA N(6)-methyladenine demethylase ALKBH1C-like n=1 Tax=Tasmannia lanceolata TaxID=3420 RepID=UPI0040643C7F
MDEGGRGGFSNSRARGRINSSRRGSPHSHESVMDEGGRGRFSNSRARGRINSSRQGSPQSHESVMDERGRGGFSNSRARGHIDSSRQGSPHFHESVSSHKESIFKKDGPSSTASGNDDKPSQIGEPKNGQSLQDKVVVDSCRLESSSGFDICLIPKRSPVKLNASLLAKNKEKRKQLECSKDGPKSYELRSGMVLLKNFIKLRDQVEIIRKCRELGIGSGGFYQPEFYQPGNMDGTKMHLQMMCLGKNWDPERKLYVDRRPFDDAKPPSIPVDFKHLVEEAIQISRSFINNSSNDVEHMLPKMSPDICIVNFYTNSGKLGLHQDRDESKESISKGLPVVSFSLGDSAEFLYGVNRIVDQAEKVILESGDVLVFGGESRLIFHGVPCILPKTAPRLLVDETNLRPGRLNLTFRQY